MARQKKGPNRVDDLIAELFADCPRPEAILGESGFLNHLSHRIIERALAGELTHPLHSQTVEPPASPPSASTRRHRRNGYFHQAVPSEYGAMPLSIPQDCDGECEPIRVLTQQRRLADLDEKILALYARGMSCTGV